MRIDKNKLFRYVQVIKTINRFSKKYLVITLFLKIFTLFSTYLLLFVNKNVINALAASINHGSIDISHILSLLIISGIIDAFTMLLFNTLQYQLGKIKLKYDDYISVKIASSFKLYP